MSKKIAASLLLVTLSSVSSVLAQDDEKMEERYRAFGVAMGPGINGVLDVAVTRWSTEEERQALIQSLVQDGREKMVELLRKQKETGWARSQTGRGMRGWPSVRLHYAHELQQPDGKRVVVLVTDRNMSMAEAASAGRSTEYDISAIVMELTKDAEGKEKGQGTFFQAAKLGFDEEKKQIVVESLGTEPIRLTNITREK